MHYIEQIHKQKPLIHHLTNWVTIYDCAQITRATGALPVMAHAKEEVEDMVSLASALVLNIGTLTSEFIEAQILAAKKANEKGIPIVLDIVGCGATPFRTDKCQEILREAKIDIIKGNQGEISVLAGSNAEVKGVESISNAENMDEICQNLAKDFDCTVVATGEIDIIANADEVKKCEEGHPIMGEVVGTGCMAASVLGCFAAVAEGKYLESCNEAMNFYGLKAEKVATKAIGPIDFKIKLMDEIINS